MEDSQAQSENPCEDFLDDSFEDSDEIEEILNEEMETDEDEEDDLLEEMEIKENPVPEKQEKTLVLSRHTVTSHLQPKFKPYSALKIMKKYKRQAANKRKFLLKWKTTEKPQQEVQVVLPEDPLQVDSLTQKRTNENLQKDGENIRKVKNIHINAVDRIEFLPQTSSDQRETNLTAVNLIKPPPFVAEQPKILPQLPKIIVKKNAKGKFSLISDKPNFSRPSFDFPKAIMYSKYERQKEEEQTKDFMRPSTSGGSIMQRMVEAPIISPQRQIKVSNRVVPVSPIVPKLSVLPIQQLTSPKPGPSRPLPQMTPIEDLFVLDDDDEVDDDGDDEESEPEPPKSPPKLIVRRRRVPSETETPEPDPIKYIIPQDMLMSSKDRLKIVDESSSSSKASEDSNNYDNADMFVIDNPSYPAYDDKLSRRKANLGLVQNNEEPIFDEPVVMPPRPKQNLELINTLAKYRVLVQSLLEKLDIPPIDFNTTDGDDYINMYKILRN